LRFCTGLFSPIKCHIHIQDVSFNNIKNNNGASFYIKKEITNSKKKYSTGVSTISNNHAGEV
jgi:CxxC motif-containing protein